jgi:hypothetical protein
MKSVNSIGIRRFAFIVLIHKVMLCLFRPVETECCVCVGSNAEGSRGRQNGGVDLVVAREATGARYPEAIATRLVALLQRQGSSKAPPCATLAGASAATKSRVVIFMVIMTFLLAMQFLMRSRQPLAHADSAGALLPAWFHS